MAKYRVEVEFDTDSGDYEMVPHNLSNPGGTIDYHMLKEALRRIFGDFIAQKEGEITNAIKKERNDN